MFRSTDRQKTPVFTGLCLVAMASVILVPSAVGSSSPTGSSGSWVELPSSTSLRDAKIVTEQGTRVGDSCVYEKEFELPADQQEIAAQEVAENPVTCQTRLEIGVPRAEASSASAKLKSASPRTGEALAAEDGTWRFDDASGDAGDDGTTAPRKHSAGYYKTWFDDPVGLDVNKVISKVDWKYKGRCVVGTAFFRAEYYWFSPSGWDLRGRDLNYEAVCDHARAATFAHFHNGSFCAGADTDTYFDRTRVWGKPNGNLVGGVQWSKNGACSGLLSFHDDLKRTLN